MSCLCQYFVTSKNRNFTGHDHSNSDGGALTDHIQELTEEKDASSKSNAVVSASELAAAKAEIWVLKKNLGDAQVSVENLENLVRTIIVKQNELLSQMYQLKQQNNELQDECRMQRDYQTMERNAMMRELQGIRSLLSDRTKLLEDTVERNTELTSSLQDANEKIYMMGMKFLKLKSLRDKQSPGRSSSGSHSDRSN